MPTLEENEHQYAFQISWWIVKEHQIGRRVRTNKSTVHLPDLKWRRNGSIKGIVEQEELRSSVGGFCRIYSWRNTCSPTLSEPFYYRMIHLRTHNWNIIIYKVKTNTRFKCMVWWKDIIFYQDSHSQFLLFKDRYEASIYRFNHIVCHCRPI